MPRRHGETLYRTFDSTSLTFGARLTFMPPVRVPLHEFREDRNQLLFGMIGKHTVLGSAIFAGWTSEIRINYAWQVESNLNGLQYDPDNQPAFAASIFKLFLYTGTVVGVVNPEFFVPGHDIDNE